MGRHECATRECRRYGAKIVRRHDGTQKRGQGGGRGIYAHTHTKQIKESIDKLKNKIKKVGRRFVLGRKRMNIGSRLGSLARIVSNRPFS